MRPQASTAVLAIAAGLVVAAMPTTAPGGAFDRVVAQAATESDAGTDAEPLTASALRDRLEGLLADGDYTAAYELALEHRGEFEGEPVFDYHYGVAALEAGYTSEGVLALERAVARRPGFARARLELARGQFMTGDDRRARRNFEQVLAHDPPPPVTASVRQYLRAIDNRADRYSTVVSGWVESGIGHDSNVNSATNEGEVSWVFSDFFGDIPLDDEDRELDDEFWRLAGHVRAGRPLARNVTGFVAGTLEERRHFDASEFDTRRLNARAGAVFHGERTRTQLSARVQRFRVDGDRYQDLVGVAADARYSLSRRTSLQGGLQWSQLDYDELEQRDSRLWLASAGIVRAWRGALSPVGSLSVFHGEESARASGDAAEARAERDIHGAGARLGLHFTPEWTLVTGFQYRRSEYGAENPLFGKTRKDDYYQVEIDLHWQPAPSWRLGPHLRFVESDSNIELFDYAREIYELRARYNF